MTPLVISKYSKKSAKFIDWFLEDIFSCAYKNFTQDNLFNYLKNIVFPRKGSSPNFTSNIKANLGRLINSYSPGNHHKSYGFLMIQGE